MRLSILIFILIEITLGFKLTRKTLINGYIANLIRTKPNVLIISYDKIGNGIISNLNPSRITITTTKQDKIDNLRKIADEVVLIPQIKIDVDNDFNEVVFNNEIIIMSDTISIFSVHTFYRTCERLREALLLKSLTYPKRKTKIILISSVNVYGGHTDGAIVNENSWIFTKTIDNNKDWRINDYMNAVIIRNGEKLLLSLNNNNCKVIIFRAGAIWNNEIERKNIEFIGMRGKYSNEIGNSWISLSKTDDIGKKINKALNENWEGIYNIAGRSYMRRDFYKKLVDINWDNENYDNEGYSYGIEYNRHLPNAMRYNMIVKSNRI